MCASLPAQLPNPQSHSSDGIRLMLGMAVRMMGAQGAVITRVLGSEHLPLVSVGLSHLLTAGIARQISGQRRAGGAGLCLIQFRNRSPLFAICLPAGPHLLVSFILTEDNSLDRCCLADLEDLASELAALIGISRPAMDSELPLTACCVCDNVQADSGQWQPWQHLVEQATGRMLSHTFCPRCLSTHYPEIQGAC